MLLDALVEDANQQDVSTEEQRERARDADTGIAMIETEAAEMNRQLEQAQQASSPQQAAQELAQATQQQEKQAGCPNPMGQVKWTTHGGAEAPKTSFKTFSSKLASLVGPLPFLCASSSASERSC